MSVEEPFPVLTLAQRVILGSCFHRSSLGQSRERQVLFSQPSAWAKPFKRSHSRASHTITVRKGSLGVPVREQLEIIPENRVAI